MEHIVVSVRDSKSEVFGRPFFAQSFGVAIRSFGDEVNRADADNVLYHHADDFQLFALGKFDDATGQFDCPEVPKLLISGADMRSRIAGSDKKVSKV